MERNERCKDPGTSLEYLQSTKFTLVGKEGFFLYVVVECSSGVIQLRWPVSRLSIKRSNLRFLVVYIDLAIMTIMLLAIWRMQYLVRKDKQRRSKYIFETSEFSVQIDNLPDVSPTYSICQLKADLLAMSENIIKKYGQQPDSQSKKPTSASSEIIDIQFVMNDSMLLDSAKRLTEKQQQISSIEKQVQ